MKLVPFEGNVLLALDKSDLSLTHQRKVAQIKTFIKSICNKENLNMPKLLVINVKTDCQMMVHYSDPLYGKRKILFIGMNVCDLDNLSPAEIKFCVCHEIGHVLADNIIFKHRLLKPIIFKKHALNCLIIAIGIFILFYLMNVMAIGIPLLIISILFILLLMHFGMRAVNDLYKIKHYHLVEEICDEFGLKITHNLSGSLNGLLGLEKYSVNHNLAIKNWAKNHLKKVEKKLSYPDGLSTKQLNNLKGLKIFYTDTISNHKHSKRYYQRHFRHSSDKYHPSDKKRLKNLKRFWRSGLKAW